MNANPMVAMEACEPRTLLAGDLGFGLATRAGRGGVRELGDGRFGLNAGRGATGAFVSKVDSSGQFGFARAVRVTGGSSAFARGQAIALDGGGDVITVGDFRGTIDLDPGAGTARRTAAGGQDMYVL